MSVILIEPHYLPCIEYYVLISSVDQIMLEFYENYQKQSYRNRCWILTAAGPIEMSVPVLNPAGKVKLRDVRIDYGQKWVKDHWRSIMTAYGSAPFFEHFAPDIYDIYQRNYQFLLELNLEFISLFNQWLNINTPIMETTAYSAEYEEVDFDWRSKIHPKKHLKSNPFYVPCNYNQIFGKKFVGNLSIIDLLFCEGPGAMNILANSKP
jgi:hypothetical protein